MMKTFKVHERISRNFVYVWSGNNFPFLNYMAVKSLLIVEPAAAVKIYLVGDFPTSIHFDEVLLLPGVQVISLDPDSLFASLPESLSSVARTFQSLSATALSARSNLLRYALLWKYGGIYLDFDTIVLRPFGALLKHEAFVGEELVWADDAKRVRGQWWVFLYPQNLLWLFSWLLRRADSKYLAGKLRMSSGLKWTNRIWGERQVNNAVMGSVPGSAFITALLLAVQNVSTHVRYATGPTLVESIARQAPDLVTIVPGETFYDVAPGETFRLFEDQSMKLSEKSVLIHYASSNHARLVNELIPENINDLRDHTPMATVLQWVALQRVLPIATKIDANREMSESLL